MSSRTPYQKLETRIQRILRDNENVVQDGRKLKFEGQLLIQYTDNHVNYSKRRYYPTNEVKIGLDDFKVQIILDNNTVELVNSIKPPKFAGDLIRFFRNHHNENINQIVIGSEVNRIHGSNLFMQYSVYDLLRRFNVEEGRDKRIKYTQRASPIIHQNYGFEIEVDENARDYQALLEEIIVSGQITQADIQSLTEQLEPGIITDNVIRQRVNRQVEWLINCVEQILDVDNLTLQNAKQLGSSLFGYRKADIRYQEELMERILTDFGQYSFFGVPALINTNKFVLDDQGLPRSQFDILLINHIGEVEIVELKRPDKWLLDFDSGRNKFYASVDLSIAIAQTERYISSIIHENDSNLRINNQTIREFITSELEGVSYRESVRPTGLIIMGSSQKIYKPYNLLSEAKRNTLSEERYRQNGLRAYRELKDSHKNIKIIDYSELMESARARILLADEN